MSIDDENDCIKNWAIAGTIFLFLIAVAVTVYFISMILTTDRTELLKNKYEYIVESLKVLGLFISGGAVIVNVYFAGRRAEAMEETAKATNKNADAANKNAEAANRNAEAANKNAEAANQKQITERFSKAIEQLASDKPEVILGGIYTLERIARDSAPDQWTIMEVLTAFVRQNAPVIKENESQSPEDQKKFLELRISIRACLTVIGERKHPDLENKYIDLTEVNISGLNLARFNLTGAVLTRANLTEAVLAGANLTEAVLTRANLTRANLRGAYRFKPDWTEVLLTEADLEGAILKGAIMPDGSIHD
jgi:uncharacterized protein YjbI with pentapeptide repeats